MITLTYKPYDVQLKHVFRISRGARQNAPVVQTRESYEGANGCGEGCMRPLYGESLETASAFYAKVDLTGVDNPIHTDTSHAYGNSIAPVNQAAKTTIDIALHEL